MPGFCSWGFSPCPSIGVNGNRSNGLAAKSRTITKNSVTMDVTEATWGSSCSYRLGVSHWARAAKMLSTSAQNSRLPSWPP